MKNLINRLLLRFDLQLIKTTDRGSARLNTELEASLIEAQENNQKLRQLVARLQASTYYYRSRYREVKGLPKRRKPYEHTGVGQLTTGS
jgi:hypothetical protein